MKINCLNHAIIQKIGVIAERFLVLRSLNLETNITSYFLIKLDHPRNFCIANKGPTFSYEFAGWATSLKDATIKSAELVDSKYFKIIFDDKILWIIPWKHYCICVITDNNLKFLAANNSKFSSESISTIIDALLNNNQICFSKIRSDEFYEELLNTEFIFRKKKLILEYNSKIKKLKNRLDNLKNDLKNAEKAEYYRKIGELLRSQFNQIKHGEKSIILTDYYDETMPKIEILLNPEYSAQQNVMAYFSKADKAKRSLEIILSRIDLTKTEIAKMQRLILDIESAENINTLQKYIPQKKAIKQEVKKEQISKNFRRFISSNNFYIMVGKSSKENDLLTFNFANGNDLWLHVEDYSGCHVIIRNNGKEIPLRTIEEAAIICAYYSKAPENEKVAIAYTRKKFVSRPKNAKSGQAMIAGAKTMLIKNNYNIAKKLLLKHNLHEKT